MTSFAFRLVHFFSIFFLISPSSMTVLTLSVSMLGVILTVFPPLYAFNLRLICNDFIFNGLTWVYPINCIKKLAYTNGKVFFYLSENSSKHRNFITIELFNSKLFQDEVFICIKTSNQNVKIAKKKWTTTKTHI